VEKLLPDGFKLFIVGELTVLSFIGCIILTIKAIAWAVSCFEKPLAAPKADTAVLPSEEDGESLAAAIAAAIHEKTNNP
jgi:sodium pump decarboxylase gamma subunit